MYLWKMIQRHIYEDNRIHALEFMGSIQLLHRGLFLTLRKWLYCIKLNLTSQLDHLRRSEMVPQIKGHLNWSLNSNSFLLSVPSFIIFRYSSKIWWYKYFLFFGFFKCFPYFVVIVVVFLSWNCLKVFSEFHFLMMFQSLSPHKNHICVYLFTVSFLQYASLLVVCLVFLPPFKAILKICLPWLPSLQLGQTAH